jgi:hypothetical protein
MNSDLHQNQAVADFLESLPRIPWFANVGKPLPPGALAKSLSCWDDWPGPEDPYVFELDARQQVLHDDILKRFEARRDDLTTLWNRVQEAVRRHASPAVPYDPEADAWHGPTSAVWQAAWTAGLMAWCSLLEYPIPPELQEQWDWFARGHWPAGYSVVWADDRLGPLLVF